MRGIVESSAVLSAGTGYLTGLRGDGGPHLRVDRRPVASLHLRLADLPTRIDFDRPRPLNKAILEIRLRASTACRHDKPDQPKLAAEVAECTKSICSGHQTTTPACTIVFPQ